MSEPSVRFRKTPKTPFIAGNLLLAATAVALVFFGPDPFSVSTVLLVALCLTAGGLLTLLPFLLDQMALATVQRMRFSQAALNLKAALARSEEILARLDERDANDSPLRLVSERLPDLVEQKLAEALEKGAARADATRREIREEVRALTGLPKDLEQLHDEVRALAAHIATREYLGTGLEALETKLYRLETLLEEWKRNRLFGPEERAPAAAVAAGASGKPVGPEEPENREPASPAPEPRSKPETESEPESGETPRPSEADANPPVDEEEGAPVSRDPGPSPAASPAPRKPSERRSRKPRKAEVIVSAFVGIQNGIFLRGDGPGLDKDAGVRLEMTGIGEWAWRNEIADAFTAELFLNDRHPSNLGPFQVAPGDVLKLNPSFPDAPR